MEPGIIIDLKEVTKVYSLYKKQTDRIKEIFHPMRKKYHRPFHALTRVSLRVQKGEFIGIIGKNGSGKSTLLQLICGILQPTSGSVHVTGRISALLELGSGFNPEFTGRENVFLNASILGLQKEEIEEKYDRIVAFADIGAFIDQPVKLYSSGMAIRLAFAVQANIDPDLLIIDEALAVGDSYFQAKCMKHMKSLVERGVTILYVTHAVEHVTQLCDRAFYLKKGHIEMSGKALPVVDAYLRVIRLDQYAGQPLIQSYAPLEIESASGDQAGNLTSNAVQKSNPVIALGKKAMHPMEDRSPCEFKVSEEFQEKVKTYRYGSGGARVVYIELLDEKQQVKNVFGFKEKIIVRAYIQAYQDIEALNCCLLVRNKHGIEIMHCTSREYGYRFPPVKKKERIIVDISFENILKDMPAYSIHYTVNNTYNLEEQEILDLIELAAVFDVKPHKDYPIWYLIWHPFTFHHCLLS